MKYTIKDIAKKANVSITTVSLVINNKPHRISKETVDKVNKIIEECDYKPNVVAQSMITNKTKTIGLIVPDITNPFFSELSKGIEDALNKYGYNVFLCNSYNNIEKEKEYIKVLMDRKVDGIIMSFSKTINKKDYDEIKKLNIPVAFVDRIPQDNDMNCLSVDDEKGGYIATKYLIDKGHKNIACITADQEIISVKGRVEGYKKALSEYRIKVNNQYIIESDLTVEGGINAGNEILRNGEVTAIFCCNDLMAIGVYEAAEKLGIIIPDDVSVIGFDNISFTKYLKPKLTTIRQCIYDIGDNAAQLIINLVNNNSVEFYSIKLDVELIERASVCKIE